MSVASEITRLQTAKGTLKTKLNAKNDEQHQITNEKLDEFGDFVDSIQTGGTGTDDSDATLDNNSKLLTGSTAYAKGVKYTGSMANKGDKVYTPSGSQQTDTAGYYNSITISATPSGTLSAPTINTSTGLVTASIGTSGYIASGTSQTLQLTTQSSQTITPTTTNQTIASGKYLTGTQTIIGDTNLTAGNIKKDVTIFGVTGTHEGGSQPTGTFNITVNGTYNVTDYATADVNVSSTSIDVTKKDVNFYDYDGTRLYSYTKTEFLALQSLPTNPTHAGLTAQGWNWDLSDAQDYVRSYEKLNVSQMYVTDDNKTRIYIKIIEGRMAPYLGFCVNGTATINWGDGNENEITGYSTSTVISTQHVYSTVGEYLITISSNSDIYLRGYSDNVSQFLWAKQTGSSNNTNYCYYSYVKKIELGNNIKLESYCFAKLSNLETITIPNAITAVGAYSFTGCYNLKHITIPKNLTNIGNDCFSFCYNIRNLSLPKSITTIDYNAFKSCYSLSSVTVPPRITALKSSVFTSCYGLVDITIPNSVVTLNGSCLSYCYSLNNIYAPNKITTVDSGIFSEDRSLTKVKLNVSKIGSNMFSNCYSLKILDLTDCTSVPTLDTTAFNNIPSDYEVWVPTALYNDWINATGWKLTSIAPHIIAK